MQVSQIFIYPVKSLGGIALSAAKVLERGLALDRRWMIVDENGLFLSQREHPKMALFRLELATDGFSITYLNDTIHVPFNWQDSYPRKKVKVWNDECDALVGPMPINKWFSDHLEQACSLVYMPDDSIRTINLKYAREGDKVSFADGYPLLFLGQASLDHLNSKLVEKVDIHRFRPNIVFTGGRSNEEEAWRSFRVGEVEFRGIKACARCQMITINQDTSIRNPEPLKVLSDYQKRGNSVLFGLSASLQHRTDAGRLIHIGDSIAVS